MTSAEWGRELAAIITSVEARVAERKAAIAAAGRANDREAVTALRADQHADESALKRHRFEKRCLNEGVWEWAVASCIAAALTWAAMLSTASAQCPRHLGEHVMLARIGWSEAGLDVAPGELAAIAAVLHSRAAVIGTDFGGAACAYSRRVFSAERTDRRRWLAHLDGRGHEPDGWAEPYTTCAHGTCVVHHRPPWRVFRARWLALVALARRVLAGDVAHACESAPDYWGAPYGADLERATRAGWVRLECGTARNAYWRVPR